MWSNERSKIYNARWRKLREYVLRRDNGLCQMCRTEGKITSGNEVDHIKPLSQGGEPYNPDNLAVICTRHHRLKSQAESMGKDFMARGCNASGIPNDPGHHWVN